MPTKLIEKCPVCGNDMYVSTLTCSNCGIEIKGKFDLSSTSTIFDLSDEDLEFLKTFLKYEGNFTKIQAEKNISYFALKEKLNELNKKLGNKMEKYNNFEINEEIHEENLGEASLKIIEKLKEQGGSSYCEMLKGDPLKIWLSPNGVYNSGFKNFLCEWKVFDAIVEKARELDGKMFRGDSAAQNGYTIGSDELPIDSIDGFISLNFYGGKIGVSTLRRSTYYAAILAWAGICVNKKSRAGEGGCIELLPEWK